jgi:hypothetical protein
MNSVVHAQNVVSYCLNWNGSYTNILHYVIEVFYLKGFIPLHVCSVYVRLEVLRR